MAECVVVSVPDAGKYVVLNDNVCECSSELLCVAVTCNDVERLVHASASFKKFGHRLKPMFGTVFRVSGAGPHTLLLQRSATELRNKPPQL